VTPAPQHRRPTGRPSLGEISELITWARRLSDLGPGNIPAAELAAYQAAKHDLLTRLTTEHPRTDTTAEQDEK
jgi:hypothetical protein